MTEEIAIIQTIDFFTPIVDDPYAFGQIAVANALSDIYAMGGIPKTAMNLVCFPLGVMDTSVLKCIIQGGLDKMKEAGVILVGGHSVEDQELKYGLSATGFIHPKQVLTKQGLKPGNQLVLTKPIGTGIVNTAIKANMVSNELITYITKLMAYLNKDAATLMKPYRVDACTDITGFGFLGHLAEMIDHNSFGIEIESKKVPVIKACIDYAKMGLIPAGAYKNREYRNHMIEFSQDVPRYLQDILFDPQTSGGLLMSVAADEATSLVGDLHEKGMTDAAIVGTVVEKAKRKIMVK